MLRMESITVILVLVLGFTSCVEQPKDLTKQQLDAAKPFILTSKPAFAHPLDINFEDHINLIGYDVSPAGVIKPGTTATVTWYWKCNKKLDDGWLLFTHVEDAKTSPRINADNEGVIRKNYPPGKWKAGEFIKDVQRINVPKDWDSPTITFYIGVWFGPHRLKVKTGAHDKENRARALVLQTGVKAKPETVSRLEVYKAEEEVKIDGKLEEKIWADARKVTLVDPVTGGKMFPATVIQAAWDDENLYVAFDATDDNLHCTYKKRDDPLYDQDAVEVLIDPDGDKKDYYEFQVSPSNLIFDSFLAEYRKNKNEWNGTLKTAVATDGTLNKAEDVDKKWITEMAIPIKDVGVKELKAGDKWKVNFFRLDTAKAGRKGYAWSAPKNNDFHKLESFGDLVFQEKKPAAKTPVKVDDAVKQEGDKPAHGKTKIEKPVMKKLTVPPKVLKKESE